MTTILVTGTGTEVGKTWVAVELVRELRARGITVAARKPAQSFSPEELGATDAELLATATGEEPRAVCPPERWFSVPMAPPMAADALGEPSFTIADFVAEMRPSAAAVTLLEGAGGAYSPLAADGDVLDLARALEVSVAVLVAHAGLGTINAVRLTAAALNGFDVIVVLNRFDDADALHRANHAWLTDAGYVISVDSSDLADRLMMRLPLR